MEKKKIIIIVISIIIISIIIFAVSKNKNVKEENKIENNYEVHNLENMTNEMKEFYEDHPDFETGFEDFNFEEGAETIYKNAIDLP